MACATRTTNQTTHVTVDDVWEMMACRNGTESCPVAIPSTPDLVGGQLDESCVSDWEDAERLERTLSFREERTPKRKVEVALSPGAETAAPRPKKVSKRVHWKATDVVLARRSAETSAEGYAEYVDRSTGAPLDEEWVEYGRLVVDRNHCTGCGYVVEMGTGSECCGETIKLRETLRHYLPGMTIEDVTTDEVWTVKDRLLVSDGAWAGMSEEDRHYLAQVYSRMLVWTE